MKFDNNITNDQFEKLSICEKIIEEDINNLNNNNNLKDNKFKFTFDKSKVDTKKITPEEFKNDLDKYIKFFNDPYNN